MRDEVDDAMDDATVETKDNNDDKLLVKKLLNDIGLNQYYISFVENEICDLNVLIELKDEQLKEIGVDKLGQRIKILNEISKLNNNTVNDLYCLEIQKYPVSWISGVILGILMLIIVNIYH